MSTVFFAKESLPRMEQHKWGRLTTITSSAVNQPADGRLLSNSILAAVAGYTRTARLDDLACTISVASGSKPEEVFAGWEREIPAGRLGTPQEFAKVVGFLASECASHVNGTTIAVDGGLVRSLL
jgi:3-oxoacyl-[acyl-carrier protein] reductase